MLSLEKTENEVLTITYEPSSSEDNFQRKLQAKISPSDQFLKTRRRNDIFQGKTIHGTKHVLIRTH